jgi:NAD(P)-dependent dehydrogenase (short-subunit alcohol dehydrogenase family)
VAMTPFVILTPRVAATIRPEAQASKIRHTLLPRAGRPKDIVNLVAFVVSNEAFITGVTIAVDGDLTPHFPIYAEEFDARARSLAVTAMQR